MAQTVTPIRPDDTLRSRETVGDRVRRLEAEAREVAFEARATLHADLVDIAGRLAEAAELTSLPAGQRDVYLRLSNTIETNLTTAQAIGARVA